MPTAQILFCSDTHLGFDDPLAPRLDIRRRGDDFYDNFKKIIDYAIVQRVDAVIHGGDFFFRSMVPSAIVGKAYQLLIPLLNANIPIYICPGNHERSVLPQHNILLSPLVRVFDTPSEFILEASGIKISLRGFPYFRDNIRKNFPAMEANIPQSNADISLLCIHQAVEGAVVGLHNYTFKYSEETVKWMDLPSNDRCAGVLCGHIHRPQVLPSHADKPAVIFAGSIEKTSFAELGEEKGFYMLRINKKEQVTRLSTPKFIPLATRGMYNLVFDNLRSDDLAAQVSDIINKYPFDAIVKFSCAESLDERIKKTLTLAFVRNIAPSTMTIQMKYTHAEPWRRVWKKQ